MFETYEKGIKEGKFYEETLDGDFYYTDWSIFLLKNNFCLSRLESDERADIRILLLMIL